MLTNAITGPTLPPMTSRAFYLGLMICVGCSDPGAIDGGDGTGSGTGDESSGETGDGSGSGSTGSGPTTGDSSSSGETGTDATPIEVLSFSSDLSSMTEGETATFTAVVDGDPLGGELRAADSTVYVSFQSEGGGTWVATLDWATMDGKVPISFDMEETRTFTAFFLDGDGDDSMDTEVSLNCGGGPACDGECNWDTDPNNCGTCGNVCSNPYGEATCVAGECGPALGECRTYVLGDWCSNICADEGKTCVENGCNGATWAEYGGESFCLNEDQPSAWKQGSCDTYVPPDGVSTVRCCCQ